MLNLWTDPQTWLALATLTALELVLGIDNVIFVAILVDRLPATQQAWARRLGLSMALLMRLGLLAALSWLVGLVEPLVRLAGHDFSGRDLILLGGGLFLLWKSTTEIHDALEGTPASHVQRPTAGLAAVVAQVMVVDLVFSLDSIVTAIGMANDLPVMMAAVVLSVMLMMAFSGGVARFVAAHASIRMLALSFLVVVGVMLMAEGCGQHVPKGMVYFAMAYALAVELLNIRVRRRAAATALPQATLRDGSRPPPPGA